MWREIFKPAYQEIMNMVKGSGKFIFYHTCGHVLALYPEFIELGIDAVNSQIHCMGLENVAEKFAGKITFWGEMDRQNLLPFGTPEEIYHAAGVMKEKLFINGGRFNRTQRSGSGCPVRKYKGHFNLLEQVAVVSRLSDKRRGGG